MPLPLRACARGLLVLLLSALAVLPALPVGLAPARAEPAAPPVRSGSVGFAPGAGLVWASPTDQARELDLVAASGARWVRLDLDWSGVEGVRGRYDWSTLDRVVDAVHARGLSVLALPAYTPAWARPVGTDTHHPPTDVGAFAAFAGAAAARYAPRGVLAWEVWNEPNLASFWSPRADVTAYATLLEAAARAIHAADPRTTVLSGGLAPSNDSATSADPRTFLRSLYAAGVMDEVDGVAVHPYSFPALASDTSTASWNTFQRMSEMRRTMVEHGDGGKQIWLTETGAPTGTARGAVSESRQAEIVLDAVASARALPWAGPVLLYAPRDAGTDPAEREDNFGLLRRDFTPKPAWSALVRLLSSTPSSPAVPSAATPAAAAPTRTTPSPSPSPRVAAVVRPSPPTRVLARPSVVRTRWVRAVSLRWTPSAGASGYRLERSPATSAPRRWTTVARTAATTVTDRSARRGTRYAYRVVPTALGATGTPSTEVRGTVSR